MVFRSRLVNLIFNRSEQNTQKFLFSNKSRLSLDRFTQVLCLLLLGFLVGNLFGTFLNTIRKYITWDGVIVFFIISIIEISNYNVYRNKNRPFLLTMTDQSKTQTKMRATKPKSLFYKQFLFVIPTFWKSFNFFKIGLMVGFFVDAFKVGS